MEKLTFSEIASAADVSRSEAGRCFHNYIHFSPMEFVLQYRVEQAQFLLKSTSLSVKEIGYKCGFRDESYFVKTFRKHAQMTPSQFRKALGEL